jgi:hypothetical protein
MMLLKELSATHFSSSETLPLERLYVIPKFKHNFDIGNKIEFQGPPKHFKMYPVHDLNNHFQNLYPLHQNTTVGESVALWSGHMLKAAKFFCEVYELRRFNSGSVWSFSMLMSLGINQFVTLKKKKSSSSCKTVWTTWLWTHCVGEQFYSSPELF